MSKIENPLMSNPLLTLHESTLLLLEWSPPFLWPGQQTDYFNVSLTNRSDDSITYHNVNATFSDAAVSLTIDFGSQGASLCSELILEISAVFGLASLPTYSISVQYQPCECISNFGYKINNYLVHGNVRRLFFVNSRI